LDHPSSTTKLFPADGEPITWKGDVDLCESDAVSKAEGQHDHARMATGTSQTVAFERRASSQASIRFSANLEERISNRLGKTMHLLFAGFKPSAADQQRLDSILMPRFSQVPVAGTHLASSWRKRALGTIKEFPVFFGKTLLLCIVPSLFGFAATSVGSWHADLLSSEFSDVTATFGNMEDLAEVRSTQSVVAECLKSTLTRASQLLGVTIALCSLVSHSVVLPSSKFTLVPMGVIFVALGSVKVVARSHGESSIESLATLMTYVCILAGLLALVVRIGRHITKSSFWWKVMIWFMVQVVLTITAEELLWPAVPQWTDFEKALFVMVVAPICAEAALTVGRFVVRALDDHNEAAGWILNGCKRG
jgi:hypothetical protein